MSLFDSLGHSGAPVAQQGANPMQMMQQLRSDPAGMLRQRGFNVPEGMRDAQQIVNHLMQTGQISGGRFQQVMQMMGRR